MSVGPLAWESPCASLQPVGTLERRALGTEVAGPAPSLSILGLAHSPDRTGRGSLAMTRLVVF